MQVTKKLSLFILLVLSFSVYSQTYVDTFYTRSSEGGSDVMIASGNFQNKNFKNDPKLNVYQKNSRHNTVVFRSLLDFDLSTIPANAIIVDAKLYLTPQKVSNSEEHPVYIELISEDWDRTTVKWNNQPSVEQKSALFFPHSLTSDGNVIHEFDVYKLMNGMMSSSGFGLIIRLKDEATSSKSGYGIRYHSSRADVVTNHPQLKITYALPLQVSGTVSHCSISSDNGSITPIISEGSGVYTKYNWYDYNLGTVSLLETGTDIANADIDNLTNGLYLLEVTDSYGIVGYQYFLVGKEGENTTVQFHDLSSNNYVSSAHNEDALIRNYYTKQIGYLQYGSSKEISAASNFKEKYYDASLLKYNVDYDDGLEFQEASLLMYSKGHFRGAISETNAGYVSRITSDWDEKLVTWDGRPTITNVDQILIPETNVIGTLERNDEIDILKLVEYWQNNPSENYGLELSLQDQTTESKSGLAYYSYDNFDGKRPVFELTFTVKSLLSTTYDEVKEEGSITVNAPDGNLPYTYLLGSAPIPSLQAIWDNIKDSTDIDSLFFFQGKENTQTYSFSGLDQGQYYVAVYDNNGQEIYQGVADVSGEIKLYEAVHLIDHNNDNTWSAETNQPEYNNARGTLYGVLDKSEDGGIEFQVNHMDNGSIGFVRENSDQALHVTQYLFGLSYSSKEVVNVYYKGETKVSYSAKSGDVFKLGKIENSYVLYRNGVLIHEQEIVDPLTENLRVDMLIKQGVLTEFKFLSKWGKFFKPKPLVKNLVLPECPSGEGEITINLPNNFFKFTTVNISIENTITGNFVPGPFANGDVVSLPIGVYVISYNYTVQSSPFSPYGYSYSGGSDEFVIGYPVDWMYDNNASPSSNISETPLNNLTPMVIADEATAIGYNLTPSITTDWWYNFSVNGSGGNHYRNVSIEMKNSNGVALELSISPYIYPNLITKYVYSTSLSGYVSVHNNKSFTVNQVGGNLTLMNNGSVLLPNIGQTYTNPLSGPLAIEVKLNGKVNLVNNYVSYCIPEFDVVNNGYYRMRKDLGGGFYQVNNDKLLFEVDVEYNMQVGAYLEYNIYSTNMQLVAGVSNNGLTVVGGAPLLPKNISENGYELDISVIGLSPGYYVLETINSKEEKTYLKFKID